MRHFRNQQNAVFGYDDTQGDLVDQAVAAGWAEIPAWPAPATLDEVKAAARGVVVRKRDEAITGGFVYLGKTIDSDRDSVMAITGAAVAALAAKVTAAPYSVVWTCADDSTLLLNADGVLGMAVALAMHADAEHNKARPLKDAIRNAPDADTANGVNR